MITRGERWFLRFSAIASGVMTLLALLSLRATFFPSDLVLSSESTAYAERSTGALLLHESRRIKFAAGGAIRIRRVLVSMPYGERLPLHDGRIDAEAGWHPLDRSFLLPANLAGVWCARSEIGWNPVLSIIEHTHKLDDACFKIPEEP